MQKADKETLKSNNKMLILCKLRKGNLSRTELAKTTGLSNSTVSVLVSELVASNVVFEKKFANSSGGRRQVILSINAEAAYTMLFEIVPNRVEISIVNLDLKINCSRSFNFNGSGEDVIRTEIERGIDWIKCEKAPLLDKTVGIGVSVAGLVDHSNDTILYSSLLNIKNMDIKSTIVPALGKNVYVFKDTDAMAMGQYTINDFYENESYLFILVDSGFGLSFMSNGQVLQLNRSGLELGHLRLKEKGPRCKCGRIGCVEAFVSETAAITELDKLQKVSGINQYDIKTIRYSDIVSESNKNDGSCRQIMKYQAKNLGRAVAIGVNIFAPNTVLLTGPISKAEWGFKQIVRKSFSENVLDIFSSTKIEFSSAVEEASITGMASKIFDTEFFSVKTLKEQ